ncbi:MAG TPA: hypothetical protein DGT23_19925 [Micromonosporaceae bacterium]|nr:hypothetical protein [Micromonosporaceae bacterium]
MRIWKQFISPEGRNHRLIVVGVALMAVVAAAVIVQQTVQGGPSDKTSALQSTPSAEGTSSATEVPEPSATPAATPTATPSPKKTTPLKPRPPLPIPAGFPSPTNTGWKHTGVTLTAVNGLYLAQTAGEVLDAKDFRGGIRIKADNVTVKRSRVQCGNCPGIWIDWNVKNTLIEDVEVTSKSKDERIDRGITAGKTINLTIRRTYVHDVQRGIEWGYSALIEDNYVDDQYNPTEAHVSGLGGAIQQTDVKLVIRHNWIAGKPGQNNSGALLYYIDNGPNPQKVDITIEQNIINGGTYALWLSADERLVGPVTVRSNMFGTKYHDLCGAYNTHFADNIHKYSKIAFTWEGNVWYAPGMAKNGSEVTYIIKY